MNEGVFESSLMQQMMAAGRSTTTPNWLNNNNMKPPLQQQSSSSGFFESAPPIFFTTNPPPTSSASSFPFTSPWQDINQQLPDSWSHLLLSGFVGEEDKSGTSTAGTSHVQEKKLLEINWEEQLLIQQQGPNASTPLGIKQEISSSTNSYAYSTHKDVEIIQSAKRAWPQTMTASSPNNSCMTSLSSSMLDFSENKMNERHKDRSPESNSSGTGGTQKKVRVQSSSSQTIFKVRKEKLGDRITALHQLVSPFGKTDTASVLLEAIGYIRFLQSQIEALSLPYLASNRSGNIELLQQQQQYPGQIERNSILIQEDPHLDSEGAAEAKDLRSRGLCLVPISCMQQFGNDNGADYWAPAFGRR